MFNKKEKAALIIVGMEVIALISFNHVLKKKRDELLKSNDVTSIDEYCEKIHKNKKVLTQ